jgi:hypothetical protein
MVLDRAAWETFHTMVDYYDGPREGLAEVDGKPYLYLSTWADIDSANEDVFKLYAVDYETLHLALESWAIWIRWEEAFHAGIATRVTHPALPVDRDRHEAIEALLSPRLADIRARVPDAHARAEFRAAVNRPARKHGWQPLQARWPLLPASPKGEARL